MSRSKRLAVDLAVSAAVPFLAIWIYEGANWIAVAGQGHSVSLTVSGLLPLGVAAVSSGGISPLTKVFQLVIAVSFLVPFSLIFGRMKLLVSKSLVVSTAGVFIASSYWEMLSTASPTSATLHTIIFVGGAGAMSFITLWAVDRQRRFNPALDVSAGP